MKSSLIMIKLLLILFIFSTSYADESDSKIYYVSVQGDDNYKGLNIEEPFKSINKAVTLSQPGDTIFILPGNYKEVVEFENKNGFPEKEICLLGFSSKEEDFPLIDGDDFTPSNDSTSFWMFINNSSWIKVGRIKFKNAWAYPIQINSSSYISFDSCYFWGAKRVVNAKGNLSHHILIENCYWDQGGEFLWVVEKDSLDVEAWLSMHHENLGYFNGSLIDFHNTGGSIVIRNNKIVYAYNALRWRGEKSFDTNVEIYNNNISYVRDNDFEPEYYTFNLHIYHNFSHNIHRTLSIDNVEGGNIYYYGNVITTDNDPWTEKICSSFWKIYGKARNRSYPLYAFNNSFYGTGNAFRVDVGEILFTKHFNNAYYFSHDENGWMLDKWDSTNEFDYDVSNKHWPKNILLNNQEQNGKIADIKFVDPIDKDLRLQKDSPGIDEGKIISFDEFNWTQSFEGRAPDIGAYENENLADGPPFRFLLPEGVEVSYIEKPRIVRFKTNSNELFLFFSEKINPTSITSSDIQLFVDQISASIKKISFLDNNYKMVIETDSKIDNKEVSISFNSLPTGLNGEKATYWASAIKIKK